MRREPVDRAESTRPFAVPPGVRRLALGLVIAAAACDSYRDRAMRGRAFRDLDAMQLAIEEFASRHGGRLPPSLDACVEDLDRAARRFRCDAGAPFDPWDGEYVYDLGADGRSWSLTSYGADRAPGGSGVDADLRRGIHGGTPRR